MARFFNRHSAYALLALLPLLSHLLPAALPGFLAGDAVLSALQRAPWVALPLIGFLGWQLNQSRILIISIGLLLGLEFMGRVQGLGALGLNSQDLALAVGPALPLGTLLALLGREGRLLSERNGLRIFLALMPLVLLAGLAHHEPTAFKDLAAWELVRDSGMRFPQLGLLAYLGLVLFALKFADRKIKPFSQALAWALIPVLTGWESALARQSVAPAEHALIHALAYASASAILAHAVFAMYWQRVYMDELTEIPNRRALDEKLEQLKPPYAIAMVDIDHFKKFNDTFGHEQGDHVLRLVAAHISKESQARAFRYGGEEFCMVFEGWKTEEAAGTADSIRASLGRREFKIRLPGTAREATSEKQRGKARQRFETVSIFLSIGVAGPDKKHLTPSDVIRLADQGLYDAKQNGRNQVVTKN